MQIDQQARPAAPRTSFWRKHRTLTWAAGIVLSTFLVLIVVLSILLHHVEPFLRARIVAALEAHFHSRVELDSFHVSLVDGIQAHGKGLRIWPPALVHGVDVPQDASREEPLIVLNEFRFHAPLRLRPGGPIHIPAVYLSGLHISLPPRARFQHAAPPPDAPKPGPHFINFAIGVIECNGAQLLLGTSKPGKLPLDFEISHFKVTNISPDGAMSFEADLTNPKPIGFIHSTGKLGPWRADDPGESPVGGDFHFDHADLGTFKGIGGMLSSHGHYQGTLRNLTVDGETQVPDFRLSHFNSPVNLYTRYHAKVDGTNGDTWLEPVDATLGHSHFTAQGQIVRVRVPDNGRQGVSAEQRTIGHVIDLNINVDKAHIDDFMRLTSRNGNPMMVGGVVVKAVLHIPPGKEPVPERMNLNGHFQLDQVRFTNPKIQDKVDELSLRSQGKGKADPQKGPDLARSQMQGDFRMAQGVINLPVLQYSVPGAVIDLSGAYTVEGGKLDFHGTARTEATVSEMVGGWKGFLLKPADRFFRKNGAGTQIPIHVQGTRDDPDFGLDFHHSKQASPERPGEKPY